MHLSFLCFVVIFFTSLLLFTLTLHSTLFKVISQQKASHILNSSAAVLMKLADFHTSKGFCACVFLFVMQTKALLTLKGEDTLILKVIVLITLASANLYMEKCMSVQTFFTLEPTCTVLPHLFGFELKLFHQLKCIIHMNEV